MLAFLKEFARAPGEVGALVPSGKRLARSTVLAAEIAADDIVVELGAGTGPMTEQLVAHHPDNPLLVLEPNPVLAIELQRRFPSITVSERYCQELPDVVSGWGHGRVQRVISSLPFAIWKEDVQCACFDAIHDVLSEDGRLVTFSYVHAQMLPAAKRLRGVLSERFEMVEKTKIAWANVPPAFVFVCDRPR